MVRLQCQWEKAVDLVHDVLGVIVGHQQIVNITEDVGIVFPTRPVCLLLEPQIRVGGARHLAHLVHDPCQVRPKGSTTRLETT
jgi:hypothetical protein